MTARYPGYCAKTGHRFAAGTEITRFGNGWAIAAAVDGTTDAPQATTAEAAPKRRSSRRRGVEIRGQWYDYVTIEAGGRGATYCHSDGFTVYGHGKYGRGSVLAGRPSRQWLGRFETLEAAKAAYPAAEVSDGCSYNPYDTDLGPIPPAWFDPTAAGEAWDEDAY